MSYRLKENAALIAVLAGLVAVAVWGVYLPQSRKTEDLEGEILKQKRRIKQDEHKIAALPEISERVRRMRRQFDDFDERLPRQQELGQFLRDLHGCLEEASLANTMIQTGKPGVQDRFRTLPITMRFSGDYLPLTDFLNQVEKMKRLTRVNELRIARGRRGGKLDITLRMNIFFKEG